MLNSKHLLILEFVKVRNLRDSICVFQRYLLLKFMFLLAQINPFVPNRPYLYPLKTSENLTENIRKPYLLGTNGLNWVMTEISFNKEK